jgi:DnaJ-class molecular chaperone
MKHEPWLASTISRAAHESALQANLHLMFSALQKIARGADADTMQNIAIEAVQTVEATAQFQQCPKCHGTGIQREVRVRDRLGRLVQTVSIPCDRQATCPTGP